MRRLWLGLAVLAWHASVQAATIARSTTFVNGQVILAADFESEFNTIYNDYNGNITAANLAATLNFDDGDLLNLASINASSNTEGLRLPQATSTSSQTTEGLLAWDTDDDMLCVGDSANNLCLSFDGDFGVSQATPSILLRDSTDNVAYLWHLDTATGQQPYDYLTLFRGTSTGLKNFTVNPLTPLLHFDSNNNVNLPTGGLRVGVSRQFAVNSSGNLTSINGVTTSWPSSQGLANRFLKNDGSGTLAWSAVDLANSVTGTLPVANGGTGATSLASVNVGTATALAANGANCSAGNYPLGVDASGAAESCTAVTSDTFSRVHRTAGDVTTTSTTLVDFTGASITVTTGANPALIGFTAMYTNNGANNDVGWGFDIDGTAVQGTSSFDVNVDVAVQSYEMSPVELSAVLTAASHTFKFRWNTTAGTATITAGTNVAANFWVLSQ